MEHRLSKWMGFVKSKNEDARRCNEERFGYHDTTHHKPAPLDPANAKRDLIMKVRITLNREHLSTGEIEGRGHLGAHIIMTRRTEHSESEGSVSLKGYDTSNVDETVYKEWGNAKLTSGDVVEIEIMPSEPAEAPNMTRSSKSDVALPDLLPEQADRILTSSQSAAASILGMLDELREELPPETFQSVARGAGKVLSEIFSSLEKQVYRQFPEKRPDDLRDLPL